MICGSRSLKCVLGYGLGGFRVVCECLGYFNGPRTDKSYAYLLEPHYENTPIRIH